MARVTIIIEAKELTPEQLQMVLFPDGWEGERSVIVDAFQGHGDIEVDYVYEKRSD